MHPEFPQAAGPVADDVITSQRQQGLAILPATFGELETEFDSTRDAQAFIEWGKRTKRVKFDRHAAEYVADPRGVRR